MSNEPAPNVETGKVVSVHYTLTDDEGQTLDTSSGRAPLQYLHGAENIVPGLERQLSGRQVGDRFQVVVSPEEGYGERVPPGPQPVPKDAFPSDVEPQPGMAFAAQTEDGRMLRLWVTEVGAEQVLVDQNHPLAGLTLHFDLEVVDVREATDQERQQGHPTAAAGEA